MKFLACLIIFIGPIAFAFADAVRLQLTVTTPEIFVGEQLIQASLKLTNTGTSDLEVPLPGTQRFNSLLSIDDPRLTVWESLVYQNEKSLTIVLKPGESVSTKEMYIGERKKIEFKGPTINFRVGFRTPSQSNPNWSNLSTVGLRGDEKFPIKIQAELSGNAIIISDVERPKPAKAHLVIQNLSKNPQYVGEANFCGFPGLWHLVTDNDSVVVEYPPCISSLPTKKVILKPGEKYEQDFGFTYVNENPNPRPFMVRVGVKIFGHEPAWSAPLCGTSRSGRNDRRG